MFLTPDKIQKKWNEKNKIPFKNNFERDFSMKKKLALGISILTTKLTQSILIKVIKRKFEQSPKSIISNFIN